MSQQFDENIVMSGSTFWKEKRAELKPVTFKLSVASMIVGFLLAVLFGIAAAAMAPFVMTPKFSVTISQPSAHTGVEAGGLLPVQHGVTGECGPDGGTIHAEARPLGQLGPGEWRTIKNIKMLPINLEQGAALSVWRIPKTLKPVGPWQARITIWCNRAPGPWRSMFRFSLLGALRG